VSILSRLLKRDEEPAPSPPAAEPAARAAVTPTGEFPATADDTTDANLVLPVSGDAAGRDQRDYDDDQVITTTVPAALVMSELAPGSTPEGTSAWSAPPSPALTQAAVEEAFRKLLAAAVSAPGVGDPAHQGSEASEADRDMAAVRAAFERVAVAQLQPVRNFMIELGWGEAQVRWIEQVTPPLASLRRALASLAPPPQDAQAAWDPKLSELAAVLDRFTVALGEVGRGGAGAISGPPRDALAEAYRPLADRLPGAFAIEGERGRREPLIVESLLQQLPELDPLAFGRLGAVGLGRLENLLRVSAEEIAYVAAVPPALAVAVVDKVAEFQRGVPAGVSGDVAARCPLEPLLNRLDACHQAHERASTGWSEHEVASKRQARRDRERAWLALRAALARLGEVDLVLALDKLPYGRRIEELQHVLRAGTPPPPAPTTTDS
jgi:hypothetical protein